MSDLHANRSFGYVVQCILNIGEKKTSGNTKRREKPKKRNMEKGPFNHKSSSSQRTALARSTININNNTNENEDSNFTLATNRAMGRRFSSIETNVTSSSGCSDISNWSNDAKKTTSTAVVGGGEIRTRNSNANHRREHEIDYRNFDEPDNHRQFHHHQHRWTVNSTVEKLPTKSYVIDNKGLSNPNFVSTNNINDIQRTNSNGDKVKWTQKAPINGNIAV